MIHPDLQPHFRTRTCRDRTVLEVDIVQWPTPQAPAERWKTFHTWPHPPSPAEVLSAQQAALRDPNYFQVCAACRETFPRGFMHNHQICQCCAQRALGIIY